MYEKYYGFTACPFRLTPDSRFWFGSESHRKAMSYLKYGLYQGEGFIVITGGVGTGKSTLVGQLFNELDPNDVVAAEIGNTQVNPEDVIRMITDAFGVEIRAMDKATMLADFEYFLLEQNRAGRRVLLIVDEAQNMPIRTLEELRMLSNINLDGQPLFQIFLLGQPQFLRTLAHPDLEQLTQRVMATYKLEPMTEAETAEYIAHRLSAVGWTGDPSITEQACNRIFRETGGVPRRINTLANRVLLFASLEELNHISEDTVKRVIDDIRQEALGAPETRMQVADAQYAQAQAEQASSGAMLSLPAPATADAVQDAVSSAAQAADPGQPAHTALPAPPPVHPQAAHAAEPQAQQEAEVRSLKAQIIVLEEKVSEHEQAIRDLITISTALLTEQEESSDENWSITAAE